MRKFIYLLFVGMSVCLFAKQQNNTMTRNSSFNPSKSLLYLKFGTIDWNPESIGLGYRYKLNNNGFDLSGTTNFKYLKYFNSKKDLKTLPINVNLSYLRYLTPITYLGMGGNYTSFGYKELFSKHIWNPNAVIGVQFNNLFIETNAHFLDIFNHYSDLLMTINVGLGF